MCKAREHPNGLAGKKEEPSRVRFIVATRVLRGL